LLTNARSGDLSPLGHAYAVEDAEEATELLVQDD
jgi:hypothetical protein